MSETEFNTRPDRFDTAILQIGLAWLPYGGVGADTVYDEFGLSWEEYARNLLSVLDRFDSPQLSARTKLQLRKVALSVLRTAARPTTGLCVDNS
jgi:hypothetical protein